MLTEEPTNVGNVLRHLIAIARQLPKSSAMWQQTKLRLRYLTASFSTWTSEVRWSLQKCRILRHIVEKRQAQASHKKHGRSEDLTSMHITLACTSKCMKDIRKKRYAAWTFKNECDWFQNGRNQYSCKKACMPYTNIVTLHHNSERVGFVYILFYYYKQQRWRPIPLNKNQTYDEHITRTHCRKGTPSPLG